MNIDEVLVESLVAYEAEQEWLEFKESWFEPSQLGEYISAISNAAAMSGRKQGYFVWGVRAADHEVVGTGFLWQRNVSGEPLEHWLARQIKPDIGFGFHELAVCDQRVVVLEIPAARVAAAGPVAYYRLDDTAAGGEAQWQRQASSGHRSSSPSAR